MKIVSLVNVILFLTLTGRSQEKINTDRPDQSDGASVVSRGKVQLETELYYNSFWEGKPALISSTLLRFGIVNNIELRLLTEQGQERDRFIAETTQGLYPLAVSAKVAIVKDLRMLPDISLVGYLHCPVTSGKENGRYWSPIITLVLEKEFDRFTFTTNASIKQEAFEKKWIWQGGGEIKMELSDHFSAFAEYFAQYDKQEAPLHNVDSGILWYIQPKWMVHVAAGTNIFTSERNYFINTGLAFGL